MINKWYESLMEWLSRQEILLVALVWIIAATSCVLLTESSTSYLLGRSPDFTLSTENEALQILNEAGQVEPPVVDKVDVNSGEAPTPAAPACSELALPENCPGPYWIIGHEISPVKATRPAE